ncbi:hypothetical protein TNCV_1311171, partial [Trichonephila clavipes]
APPAPPLQQNRLFLPTTVKRDIGRPVACVVSSDFSRCLPPVSFRPVRQCVPVICGCGSWTTTTEPQIAVPVV